MDKEIKDALDAKFNGLTDKLTELQDKGASKSEVEALHNEIKTSGQAIEDFVKSDYVGTPAGEVYLPQDLIIKMKDWVSKNLGVIKNAKFSVA